MGRVKSSDIVLLEDFQGYPKGTRFSTHELPTDFPVYWVDGNGCMTQVKTIDGKSESEFASFEPCEITQHIRLYHDVGRTSWELYASINQGTVLYIKHSGSGITLD